MNPRPKRFRVRPLLAASAGLALITISACGGQPVGNLMPVPCDGGVNDVTYGCPRPVTDGGTDAGQ